MTHARSGVPPTGDADLSAIPTQIVAGVRLAALDLPATAEVMADLVGSPRGHATYTCNVDHVMMLKSDPEFARAYAEATLVTADGAPLVALARALGGPVERRVTGADLVPALAGVAARRGLVLALVGGKEGVAQRASELLTAANPGLTAVAPAPPPFGFRIGDASDDELVRSLQDIGPSLVVVCFGAPKQELWIAAHRGSLPGAVLLGAGASLDFVVGEQTRAPLLWQRLGLEFVWRLLGDWPRLWRRYLLRDSGFVLLAARELLAARRSTG